MEDKQEQRSHAFPFLICLPSVFLPHLQEKIDILINNHNSKNQRQAVRIIQKDITKNELDVTLVKDFRFVSADVLNVREKPSRASK